MSENGQVIEGNNCNNRLIGTDGNDVISGNGGHDLLKGGEGDDIIDGGSGNDVLIGGEGDDTMYGQSGCDFLKGGIGNDTLFGGTGHDVLLGGSGNDILDGGSGNDFLAGGSGNDLLKGGYGNDFYWFNPDGGQDTISGESGGWRDTIAFKRFTTDLTIDLQAGVVKEVSGSGSAGFSGNTTTAGTQGFSKITNLANGGFVLTWNGAGAGDNDDIHAQRFDANGNKVGTEFIVNTATAGGQGGAVTTGLTDGGFVITWTNDDGSFDGIFGQRFDANGNKVGGEFAVNTTTTGDQDQSAVAALADGGFVVTFTSPGTSPINQSEVFLQRFDANGNKVGSEVQVNTTEILNQSDAQVVGLDDGGYVVVYSSNGIDGGNFGVAGQRFDASGAKVGGEFVVNTFTTGNQQNAEVASLSNGGFVVSWDSDGQDGDGNGVYAQIYDANGDTVGSEFQVNTNTTGNQSQATVTGLQNGGFVMMWQDDSGAGGDGTDVFAQIFDASGNKVGSEFQVNGFNSDFQGNASVTTLESGGFVVSWDSEGQDGDGMGVFGKRYNADGTEAGTIENTIVTIEGTNKIEAAIGGKGNDLIIGTEENNDLYGKDGDDVIQAGDGHDWIVGGRGNDLLEGGNGNDYYIYGRSNFGQDVVFDASGSNDYLSVKYAGLKVSDATFAAIDTNNDGNVDALNIAFTNGSEITIEAYFDNS
ncbi:MAG: hypothetical protein KTR14_09935, partial [Vampirovibrio sp.]|nr:hypothetical protein [Vampirovibrio sp.]